MISIRAVLFGLLAAVAWAPQAAAEVNIIYPPKRDTAHQKAAPVGQRQAIADPAVIVFVPRHRHRETRKEIIDRALFQNWTGFIKVYSGPQYPGFYNEYSGPRYPF